MNAEWYGPRLGDKVLLVISEQEIGDLLQLILGRREVRLTVASTIAEAIRTWNDLFDVIWFCLPLPSFHTHLFLDLVLAQTDLAHRVGIENPLQVIRRIHNERPDLFPYASTLGDYTPRQHDEKWIWIRVNDQTEREWLKHLLEECQRRKPEGRE